MLLFAGLVIFFGQIPSAAAQETSFSVLRNDFSIVPQVCGKEGQGECNACDFAQLINNVFDFLIFAATVVTTFMFLYAGFLLITAGDSDSDRSKARTVMTNVVVGFVFLLGSWVIVDTIMKAFLKNNGQLEINGSLPTKWGPWNNIICPPGFVPNVGKAPDKGINLGSINDDGASTGGGALVGNSPISGTAGCADCVDLTKTGFTCRIGSGGPCEASAAIIEELKALKRATAADWVVTAGYQKVGHSATCQTTYGTCIDAAFTDRNYTDINRIVNFQKAASAAGCPAQFESNDGALVGAVNRAGGNALLINYPPHFSLYCNK